jgi:hypothetical protein
MGFWMGGRPGYGYRRRMISEDGKPKVILKDGQQKSVKTDRIKLTLGPRNEVEASRFVFSMAAERTLHYRHSSRIESQTHTFINGRGWNVVTVLNMLRNPKYMGTNVWYRHTQRLHSPQRLVDPQFWIGKPGAFPPIVDAQTFERAQATIRRIRNSHWSAERVLKTVGRLLKSKGRLSESLITKCHMTPSAGTIYRFFGTYQGLYEALNYKLEHRYLFTVDQARRSARLRHELGTTLAKLFPENIKIVLSWRGARSVVRVDDRYTVSILFCRQETPYRKNAYRLCRQETWSSINTRSVLGS